MTAARTGKVDVMKALLANDADPNAREQSRGQTALMWAAAEDNADAVKVLLEAGAERDARTGDQAPPAATAAGSFSRAAGVSRAAMPSLIHRIPLYRAARTDRRGTRAPRRRVDVNQALPDGTSALVLAVQNGHWEFADFLLDWGADVNAAGSGFTALHQITRLRRTNIGFLPPPVGKGSISSIELVSRLLAKHADVNAVMTRDFRDGYRNRFNRIGATPFLLAAKNVDTELMKIYLAAGADPMTPNADKTTSLMVAAGVDMWNPGEDGGSGQGSEPEALEAVKMLVGLGNDVNATNDRGETAMHGAAYRGAKTIVQYLGVEGREDRRPQHAGVDAVDHRERRLLHALLQGAEADTANYLETLMAERGISTEGMADDGTHLLRLRPQRRDTRATPRGVASCSRRKTRSRRRLSGRKRPVSGAQGWRTVMAIVFSVWTSGGSSTGPAGTSFTLKMKLTMSMTV